MWSALLYTVAISRVLAPFTVFLYPVFSAFINIFLDAIDGYIAFRAGWKHERYHKYDKILDYWWYIFIVIYAADLEIFPVIFILFVFRTVGQIASIVTTSYKVLFLFPNILETFFDLFIIASLYPNLMYWFTDLNQVIPLFLSTFLSIAREFILHVKKISIGNILFKQNFHWEHNE
ncbi:hypothetical protein ACFL1A_02960 [Patescibacteria group bacterium]